MVSSCRGHLPAKNLNEISHLALDNGAFSAWRRGYPFDEYTFLKTLAKCLEHDLHLDFITCPDIIGAGKKSLDFSLAWADRIPCNKLALVVQAGMEESDVLPVLERFSYIFVGGPDADGWKWRTAPEWVQFAHRHGKKCHIGATGTIDKLIYAQEIGADSVDSSSFCRHDSWHIIEEFLGGKQEEQLTFFEAPRGHKVGAFGQHSIWRQ